MNSNRTASTGDRGTAVSFCEEIGGTAVLHGVITDDVVRQMRERTEARRQEAVERLGAKHLLHPANHVQRKP